MNITTPILAGAAHLAALPGEFITSLVRKIGEVTGLFNDGRWRARASSMSGLAGAAAALAVAFVSDRLFP